MAFRVVFHFLRDIKVMNSNASPDGTLYPSSMIHFNIPPPEPLRAKPTPAAQAVTKLKSTAATGRSSCSGLGNHPRAGRRRGCSATNNQNPPATVKFHIRPATLSACCASGSYDKAVCFQRLNEQTCWCGLPRLQCVTEKIVSDQPVRWLQQMC